MPDVVSGFKYKNVLITRELTMIYAGKELYLKDLLLPNYSDAEKMGYTSEQINGVMKMRAICGVISLRKNCFIVLIKN
jgi:hypothetical protein